MTYKSVDSIGMRNGIWCEHVNEWLVFSREMYYIVATCSEMLRQYKKSHKYDIMTKEYLIWRQNGQPDELAPLQ